MVSSFMKISSKTKELMNGNSFLSNSSTLLSNISPWFFTSNSIIEFNIGFWFQRYDSIKFHQTCLIFLSFLDILKNLEIDFN